VVKLFRYSEIGTACFAKVDDSQAAEIRPGLLCDSSPDNHLVNTLELGHLSASRRKVAEEMLLRRHKAISHGDDDLGLTDWIVHNIELKEGQETPRHPALIDLIKGLFSSLDIVTYILPTCWP
jgi:hypothetical protein